MNGVGDATHIFPKVQHPVSDLLTEILEFQLCTFTHAIIGKSLAFIRQRSRFSDNVWHGDSLSVGNKLRRVSAVARNFRDVTSELPWGTWPG